MGLYQRAKGEISMTPTFRPVAPPMRAAKTNGGPNATKPTPPQTPAPPRKPWERTKAQADREPDTWYYRQAKVSGVRLKFTLINGKVYEGVVLRDGRYSVLVRLDERHEVLVHKHALESVQITAK